VLRRSLRKTRIVTESQRLSAMCCGIAALPHGGAPAPLALREKCGRDVPRAPASLAAYRTWVIDPVTQSFPNPEEAAAAEPLRGSID
jgi:hypothetical protein